MASANPGIQRLLCLRGGRDWLEDYPKAATAAEQEEVHKSASHLKLKYLDSSAMYRPDCQAVLNAAMKREPARRLAFPAMQHAFAMTRMSGPPPPWEADMGCQSWTELFALWAPRSGAGGAAAQRGQAAGDGSQRAQPLRAAPLASKWMPWSRSLGRGLSLRCHERRSSSGPVGQGWSRRS